MYRPPFSGHPAPLRSTNYHSLKTWYKELILQIVTYLTGYQLSFFEKLFHDSTNFQFKLYSVLGWYVAKSGINRLKNCKSTNFDNNFFFFFWHHFSTRQILLKELLLNHLFNVQNLHRDYQLVMHTKNEYQYGEKKRRLNFF